MANKYGQRIFDAALLLQVSTLIAATADTAILDLGEGLVMGDLVIDLAACEIASGDEIYTLTLEMSNTADMTSGSVASVTKVFGNLVAPMDGALSDAERYIVPFRNEEGGELYQYARLHIDVAGTIATGIEFEAFLTKA